MVKKKLSILDIRQEYEKHLTKGRTEGTNLNYYNLWGHIVLRRISYYPSWLLLRLGASANSVTLGAFAIGCVGCLLLAIGEGIEVIIGALLLNLWALFDYVDGNMARCSGSSSRYGKLLDSICDQAIASLLFISAGVGAFHYPDYFMNSLIHMVLGVELNKSMYLVLGGWASTCFILSLNIGYSFERIFLQNVLHFISIKEEGKALSTTLRKIGITLISTSGLVMPLLFFATLLKLLGTFVFVWSFINTIALILLLVQVLKKVKASS